MAAYQLSLEHSSQSWFVSKLNINGQYEQSISTEEHNTHLSQYSLLAEYFSIGLHYFGVTYRTNVLKTFTDCTHSYNGNTNLFAVYLPSHCSVRNILPQFQSSYSTSWTNTDLIYKLSLSQMHHVFIKYQTTHIVHGYTKARLVINSVIQPHTMSIKSRTNEFAGLFGFWQGSLPAGTHQITVQHKGSNNGALYNGDPYTIAMDIVYCY